LKIITLDDHLDKFQKVINCKWKEETDIKKRIDLKVKLLKYYYRQPQETDDFVLLELFNVYLLGGYDKKYDPSKSNLMTYITIFIDTHLDAMLSQRRKRYLWDNGERVIDDNGFKKKLRFRSCDIYDKVYLEPIIDDDRDIRFRDPEDPETILLKKEVMQSFWQFAKEKDRINEAKIVLGLEDYEAIARQTITLKDTIRIRVYRLLADFKEYYYHNNH
jgi:hypothetical protein